MRRCSTRPQAGREGVALVIVMGFLALMIIMAVGFAVSMRVERLAARNSLDVVKARQLTYVAFSRAMEDIENSAQSGGWFYPPRQVMYSTGSNSNAVKLLNDYGTNYIPRWAWRAATNADDGQIKWTEVRDSKNTLLGRVAYLAVDCSGLIDINRAYDTQVLMVARGPGFTVNEIALTNDFLGDLVNSTTATNIFWNKRYQVSPTLFAYGQIFTVADLTLQGYWGGNAYLSGSGHPTNFTCFSAYPQGWWDSGGGTVRQPVYLGTGAWDNAAIQTALAATPGLSAAEAGALLDNLLDYRDADSKPRSLTSFCTEPTPLFTEVVVSNFVSDISDPVVTNEIRLWVEMQFPFLGRTTNGNYQMEVRAAYRDADPTITPSNISFIAPSFYPVTGTWTSGAIRTFQFVSTRVATNPANPGSVANARMDIRLKLYDGADELDGVGIPATANLLSIPLAGSYAPVTWHSRAKAVNDPRLNWDGADAAQWILQPPNVNTLSNINDNVATYGASGSDGSPFMYVRNGDLWSVGELGFLLYSASRPWQTIRLLDPNAHAVLDRFTLHSPTNVLRGLININTTNVGVLATAFFKAPIERYPLDPAYNSLMTESQWVQVARAIATNSIQQGFRFTNLSDLKQMRPSFAGALNQINPSWSTNEMLLESMVRTTCGLVSPRQNLFSMILVGQSLNSDSEVMAEARATCLVWRDPYPVAGAPSPTLVRYFKWLTE